MSWIHVLFQVKVLACELGQKKKEAQGNRLQQKKGGGRKISPQEGTV